MTTRPRIRRWRWYWQPGEPEAYRWVVLRGPWVWTPIAVFLTWREAYDYATTERATA